MNRFIVESQQISDGSVVFNVIGKIEEIFIRFACVDKIHADNLCHQLERISWAEYEIR